MAANPAFKAQHAARYSLAGPLSKLQITDRKVSVNMLTEAAASRQNQIHINKRIKELTLTQLLNPPSWLTTCPETLHDELIKVVEQNWPSEATLKAMPYWQLPRGCVSQFDLDKVFTCRHCRRSRPLRTDSDLFGECRFHAHEYVDNQNICLLCNPDYKTTKRYTREGGCRTFVRHVWTDARGEWKDWFGALTRLCPSARRMICIDAEFVGVAVPPEIEASPRPPHGSTSGNSIVTFSAVDVLTNEILMNCIVEPHEVVTDWREAYTGVNEAVMQEASKQRKVVRGLSDLQYKFRQLINQDTIIVGFAVANDLLGLRLAHAKIFDVQVHRYMRRKEDGVPKLKYLALENLDGAKIQNGTHGSLEDALATAEILRRGFCPRTDKTDAQLII